MGINLSFTKTFEDWDSVQITRWRDEIIIRIKCSEDEEVAETTANSPLEDYEWVTVPEYSKRYGIPKPTIWSWTKHDIIPAKKDVYPMLVLDGEKVPVREVRGKRVIWHFVDRDDLNGATTQSGGATVDV